MDFTDSHRMRIIVQTYTSLQSLTNSSQITIRGKNPIGFLIVLLIAFASIYACCLRIELETLEIPLRAICWIGFGKKLWWNSMSTRCIKFLYKGWSTVPLLTQSPQKCPASNLATVIGWFFTNVGLCWNILRGAVATMAHNPLSGLALK